MKFRSAYRALAVVLVSNALAVLTSPTVSAVTKSISVTGTSSPQTGGFTPSGDGHATMIKFPGQSDAEDGSPGSYPGTIVNSSLSSCHGNDTSHCTGPMSCSHAVTERSRRRSYLVAE